MRNTKADNFFIWLLIILTWAIAAYSTGAYAESMSPEAKRELAAVARKAIADDIHHACFMSVPDYAATEAWSKYCKRAGEYEAQLLDDDTAIAEFKRMLELWAEAAKN